MDPQKISREEAVRSIIVGLILTLF